MTLRIDQPLQQGRYRIRQRLGQGGMGTVYLAEDRNLPGQLVAIKENIAFSRTVQEQFQREAVILARLNHPNLPRVTDHFIEPNGRQYLVMDYIQGEDLREIRHKEGPILPESQVLAWMEQVMDALDYMHTWVDTHSGKPRPIIHRDIKPGNIKRTPQGRIILVDFGLAKVQDGLGTSTGARAISDGYSPVEQYTGGTDVRSDIYAVGATLYTLLTGVRPVDAPARAAGALLAAPRAINPRLTRETERVILRAMAMQPNERYPSMAVMRADLYRSRQASPFTLFAGFWRKPPRHTAVDLKTGVFPPNFTRETPVFKQSGGQLSQTGTRTDRSFFRSLFWVLSTSLGILLVFLLINGRGSLRHSWATLAGSFPFAATPLPTVVIVPMNSTIVSVTLATRSVTATWTPSPTKTPKAAPSATAMPTQLPTATPVRSPPVIVQSTSAPQAALYTATAKPTSSPIFTATATRKPTSTPIPTRQRTPTPRSMVATVSSKPTPAAPAAHQTNNATVVLVEPLEPVLGGRHIFRWTANFTLEGNQRFELIFWPVGQDPMEQGFSPIGAGPETAVLVDLDKSSDALPNLLNSGHDYAWGVRLVEVSPYQKLQYLGGGHTFRFQRTDNQPNSPLAKP